MQGVCMEYQNNKHQEKIEEYEIEKFSLTRKNSIISLNLLDENRFRNTAEIDD